MIKAVLWSGTVHHAWSLVPTDWDVFVLICHTNFNYWAHLDEIRPNVNDIAFALLLLPSTMQQYVDVLCKDSGVCLDITYKGRKQRLHALLKRDCSFVVTKRFSNCQCDYCKSNITSKVECSCSFGGTMFTKRAFGWVNSSRKTPRSVFESGVGAYITMKRTHKKKVLYTIEVTWPMDDFVIVKSVGIWARSCELTQFFTPINYIICVVGFLQNLLNITFMTIIRKDGCILGTAFQISLPGANTVSICGFISLPIIRISLYLR